MGACACQKNTRYDPATQSGDLGEHDAGKLSKDPLIRFEKQFPFYRTHIVAFNEKIFKFGKTDFEIGMLANAFNTPAWEGKFEKGEPLYELITSLPECGNGTINITSIGLLGILWCAGDIQDKSDALFQQINPPGQNQDSVSAQDKDWNLILGRIFYIASYWSHKQANAWAIQQKDMTQIDGSKFDDEEMVKRAAVALRMSEDGPDHRGFIDLLFGHESVLQKSDYDKAVINEQCKWIFNATEIRKKMEIFIEPSVLENFESEYEPEEIKF